MEATMDLLRANCSKYGTSVYGSPLMMGLKKSSSGTSEAADLFSLFTNNNNRSKKDNNIEHYWYCYNTWGRVPMEIRQGPSTENRKAILPAEETQSSKYRTCITPYGQRVAIKHGIQMTPGHHALYDVSTVTTLSELTRFVKFECHRRGFTVVKHGVQPGGEVEYRCTGSTEE
jgi:hypothetical protein